MSNPVPKRKVLTLREWPADQRPRERLFSLGIGALSDAELLTLFLRSGQQGKTAHQLALDLLKDFGSLHAIVTSAPKDLLGVPGLGPAKVASLVASFEISKRVLKEKSSGRPLVDSVQDLYAYFESALLHAKQEIFLAAVLNAKNEIVRTIEIARGGSDHLFFTVPHVLRLLVLEGASRVIFVHNHPSGDPKPSSEDKKVTSRLQKACFNIDIEILDHLIIGSGRPGEFFSFAQAGIL